jgi:hypothetical protein
MKENTDIYCFINSIEGKRPWENIKKHFKEMQWDGVQWIQLAQDKDQCCALVNMVMNTEFEV